MLELDRIFWFIQGHADLSAFFCEYFSAGLHSPGALLALEIFSHVKFPYSILREPYHIDRAYSEEYYYHYASKHILSQRFCERLSIFLSEVVPEDFLDEEEHERIRASFVGCMVIKPLQHGLLGRTLLDPFKLATNGYPSIADRYIRTVEYEVTIHGVRLSVRAFPFRTQDGELLSCAHVALLNLAEYFGTRYSEYRVLYADTLGELLRENGSDSAIPSRGLAYPAMMMILSKIGFSPRLYDSGAVSADTVDIRRIIYYYIESGIPLIVGLARRALGEDGRGTISNRGHAMVLIGRGCTDCEPPVSQHWGKGGTRTHYINAADFYGEFVVMNDQSAPYDKLLIQSGDELSLTVIAPLYKRIYMEAMDAYAIATRVIVDEEIGLRSLVPDAFGDVGSDQNPLVFRLFLAPSRSYKAAKMRLPYANFPHIKQALFDLPLPRFIWICEVYTRQGFAENRAYGEVVIDATANRNSLESVLMVQYPHRFAFRYPDESFELLSESLLNEVLPAWEAFPGYDRNLSHII